MLIINGVCRLTKDPKIVYTKSSPLAKFTVAFNGSNGNPVFLDCSTFKNPENLIQYLKKGSLIFVTGELRTDQWIDRNSGETRKAQAALILSWSFVGKKDVEVSDAPQQSEKSWNGGNGGNGNKAGDHSITPTQPVSYEEIPY
jgi:single-strand DNA-binding protein